jgi:hypothetical protein
MNFAPTRKHLENKSQQQYKTNEKLQKVGNRARGKAEVDYIGNIVSETADFEAMDVKQSESGPCQEKKLQNIMIGTFLHETHQM